MSKAACAGRANGDRGGEIGSAESSQLEKKLSPLSTLANGSVCLGLVSSLGLGEWWKWKSFESQIQGRGSGNKLAAPHVHNQQLSGCAGAEGLQQAGPWPRPDCAPSGQRRVWVPGQSGLDHYSTIYLLILGVELRSVLKLVSQQPRTSCSWQHSCSQYFSTFT